MKITDVTSVATNRRGFLKGAGMAGIGLAGSGMIASKLLSPIQKVQAAGVTDPDILNFALNLEYLEAEYYCVATLGKTLVELGIINPSDTTGPTTGGALISGLSSTSPESYISTALRINETDHVKLLRGALGSAAVKKPAINLDALGYGFSDVDDFLKITRQFEDVGTSAYLGAAPLISSSAYLSVAGSILTVEAKHSGALRLLCIMNGVNSPAVDSIDIPPVSGKPFGNPVNGLTVPRTTSQVLNVVYGGGMSSGGFFPDGLNGTITSQS
jgi:hypothetical protein